MAKSKQLQKSDNSKADATTQPDTNKTTSKKTSEIDDIFATKKIAKVPNQDEKDKDQSQPALTKQQKRKQKKKAAAAAAAAAEMQGSDSDQGNDDEIDNDEQEQHKVQEVIFAQLAAAQNLKRKNPPPPPASTDDDHFGDSRGKKAKRTTDDGYPLYDVKDLRIGEGQDTPDCPFDCQCCF